MAISAISGSSAGAYMPATSDPQVQALKAKIQDWTDCPTTDATTKKAIVGRLQVQLDSLTSLIRSSDDSKKSEAAASSVSTASPGSRLDIRA